MASPQTAPPNILNSTLNPSAPPFKPPNRPPSPPPSISKPRCRQTNSSISNKSLMVGHTNINRLRHKTHQVQEIIDQHQLAILYRKRGWTATSLIVKSQFLTTAFFVTIGKTRKEGVYVYLFIPLLLQINYPWNTQKSTLSNQNQRQFLLNCHCIRTSRWQSVVFTDRLTWTELSDLSWNI